uniref:Uncharacterized protein n=1 Tax=Rhizophora mucronata TaxID=61149 RepID=A0A2P2JCG5_RHIMU
MGIHLYLSQLGEARQHTAMLPCTPPGHQKILFYHLQSHMFRGLCQQLPKT